jgi:indolepyruvate ferredoxin oxidoreductase alpha subunit
MSKINLLSGNEAVAHAALRAGCHVAAAYPGTPSTEILEVIATFDGAIDCEWSVNEKVAMEIGVGASIAGGRALVAMKHVGLNVAMDPLMTYTYIGTNGGLVVVSADDPGMHSSQNEQDNRALVKFARAAQFEPANSQEAYDMTREAFELSERTGSIVFIRLTTRTAHSSSPVDLGDDAAPGAREPRPYVKDIKRNVAVPANARVMRVAIEKRLAALREESEKSPFNRIEAGDSRLGIVTSAVAYTYVKEAFPEFAILKLGFSNPLPLDLVRRFAGQVEKLVVVEELDPIIRDGLLAAGIPVAPCKTDLSMMELNPTRVRALRHELLGDAPPAAPVTAPVEVPALPTRPPVLCAGCSHRGVFYTLARLGATVSGDIGCYTLGSAPPLGSLDTTICMGASIGAAFGMRKAGMKGRLAAVIGDSTFFHSGMTGILDLVYNRGPVAVLVLDNRITAMTGHQQNPGSGRNLSDEAVEPADIARICRALGVKRVAEVNAYDLARLHDVLEAELDCGEPSVVVVKGDCALAVRRKTGNRPYAVDPGKCKACGACFKLGCPAIIRGAAKGKTFQAHIDPAVCFGCNLCHQTCKFGAIAPKS